VKLVMARKIMRATLALGGDPQAVVHRHFIVRTYGYVVQFTVLRRVAGTYCCMFHHIG